MRYVVYGAGAVGGVIGAHLHRAGLTTTLIARGAHLEAVREHGLVLDTVAGVETVDVPVASGAREIAWTADTAVLLTVKSHQSAAALDDLVAHAPPGTPVVCAQNGVANERSVLRRFAATYAMCVMLPAAHVDPGVVVQQSWPVPGILDLGRYPGGVDDLARDVAADLARAGFESQARPDAMAWKYRKLVMNLANGVTATCRPGGPAYDELIARARAEGEQVFAAAGIPVVSAAQDAERRGELLQGRSRDERTRGGSTWQSLSRATGNVEIDYLAGEVVLLGRLHGVATPVNELLQRATNDLARTHGSPASLDPAVLLATLEGTST